MKDEKMSSLVELYICNFKRDNEACCFDLGAKVLTDNLKNWAKTQAPEKIKVYRSGCLGKCSQGIAIACYPDKKVILEVKSTDEEEIKKGLKVL